jgi:hypothetical protein
VGEIGLLALGALAAAAWLLVALARTGRFALWPLALPFVLAALALGLWAWLRAPWPDRLATLALAGVALGLALPPSQPLALSGDAAIYANEGAFVARTGRITAQYEPLAPLGAAERDLFYISSSEQAGGAPGVQAYDGLLYGGYYVVEPGAPLIRTSRMGQLTAWFALAAQVGGLGAGFWVSPLAGALALCLLYAVARRVVARPLALWAALLLGVLYPQVYLARAPYAEILGQVWTLTGFWCAVRWLDEGSAGWRRWLLPLALLCWVTAWSARIDALLLAGPGALLLFAAAWRRDGAALRATAYAVPLLAALVVLGANPPYVGGILEIALGTLAPLRPAIVAFAVAVPLALAVVWLEQARLAALWRRLRWPLLAVVLGAATFAVLWATLPNPWRDPAITRPFQEILWFSSAYVTPLLYWLALLGAGLALVQESSAAERFLAMSLLGLGAAYTYAYTSAPVYPVSLRRLAGDVLPLAALLAAVALQRLPWPLAYSAARRAAQAALAAALLLWAGSRSLPLLAQHEAADELRDVQTLHAALPPDGAFLFEPQDGDSWIGWLAAPLYSLYGDWALLLESDTPDPDALAGAVRALEAAGRTVYVVSQSSPLPATLTPPGHTAAPVLSTEWDSSLIGQTRAPYPPPYWEFRLPVHVYRLAPEPP